MVLQIYLVYVTGNLVFGLCRLFLRRQCQHKSEHSATCPASIYKSFLLVRKAGLWLANSPRTTMTDILPKFLRVVLQS
jgi:hypothetical protein